MDHFTYVREGKTTMKSETIISPTGVIKTSLDSDLSSIYFLLDQIFTAKTFTFCPAPVYVNFILSQNLH